jgi:HSP20 family protein
VSRGFGEKEQSLMGRDDILDDLEQMRSEVESFFEGFCRFRHTLALTGRHVWRPSADVYESRDHIVVVLELAGVAADDLEVFASRRALTIRGTRRNLTPLESHRNYRKMEIQFGDFEKIIPLWCRADIENLETTLERGILTIRIPKLQEPREEPRTIPIE